MNNEAHPAVGPRDRKDIRTNIVWHDQAVSVTERASLLGQRGSVVWFTGLSGCGKSTIANVVDQMLHRGGRASILLDGDNLRHALCAPPSALESEHGAEFASRFGLGFGAIDREENIRRIGAVAALMASAGLITLAAFVSPYRKDRNRVRAAVEAAVGSDSFLEVFVDTPLNICQQRDPKGLYKKALAGEIKHFTGISDPYETPESPEIHLEYAEGMTPEKQAEIVLGVLRSRWS
ncbi:MAG: adenylyl-sulfate kinase [Planctomycetota bacterium]